MDHIVVIIRFGPHAFCGQTAHVITAFVAEGAELRRQDQRRRHVCRQFAEERRSGPAVVTGAEELVKYQTILAGVKPVLTLQFSRTDGKEWVISRQG